MYVYVYLYRGARERLSTRHGLEGLVTPQGRHPRLTRAKHSPLSSEAFPQWVLKHSPVGTVEACPRTEYLANLPPTCSSETSIQEK